MVIHDTQTNVYPSAQKRKMRNFGGFIRRAIVIVPTDEEFQRRCEKREAEEGKDIPDSAVLEMKGSVNTAFRNFLFFLRMVLYVLCFIIYIYFRNILFAVF